MDRPLPDLRLLRYFLAVARERSLTRAAARLHMAQPPLSQQIAMLEQMLGCSLFIRRPRGVELTDAARALVPRAEAILRALDDTMREVRDVADGSAGVVRIAAVPTAAAGVLAAAFAAFREERPRVVLALRETGSLEALALVADGHVDLGILRGPVEHPDITVSTLFDEPFVLIVEKGHRLARRRDPIALDELADEPFILFDVDARMPLHAAVLAACTRAGFTPRVACEGAELLSLGRFVEAGIGVSLVPRSTASLLAPLRVVAVPLADPAPMTSLVLVAAEGRPVPAAAAGFRDALLALWPA